jgi:hypothetical protein
MALFYDDHPDMEVRQRQDDILFPCGTLEMSKADHCGRPVHEEVFEGFPERLLWGEQPRRCIERAFGRQYSSWTTDMMSSILLPSLMAFSSSLSFSLSLTGG